MCNKERSGLSEDNEINRKGKDKNMKKIWILVAGAALVGMMAVQGFAWGGGPGRGKGMMGSCMEMAPESRAAFLKDTAELRVALETNRAELAAAMSAEHPDTARVEALYQEMARHKAAMAMKAKAHGLAGMGDGCGCDGMRQGRMGAGRAQ
jgi:hypothetical protein